MAIEEPATSGSGLDVGQGAFVDDLAAVAPKDGESPGSARGKLGALRRKADPGDRARIDELLDRTKSEAKSAVPSAKDPAQAARNRGAERARGVGDAQRATQDTWNRIFGRSN